MKRIAIFIVSKMIIIDTFNIVQVYNWGILFYSIWHHDEHIYDVYIDWSRGIFERGYIGNNTISGRD